MLLNLNPLTAAIGRPFFGQKLPAARARELFKPSTDLASLLVEIKKNAFRFRFGYSRGDVTMRACFQIFGHRHLALGPDPLTHSFESKFS